MNKYSREVSRKSSQQKTMLSPLKFERSMHKIRDTMAKKKYKKISMQNIPSNFKTSKKNLNIKPIRNSLPKQLLSNASYSPSYFFNHKDSEEHKQDQSLRQIKFLQILGKGGFGRVWKVEYRRNQYALKQMSKLKIIMKKSVKSVLNQKLILTKISNNFIINIYKAFQNKQNLFLLMELLLGGDLRFHLTYRKKFTEKEAKFMVACIVLGLQKLRQNNIIHRDLKPENLVFEQNGYLKITDFGIARFHKQHNSMETSGTPGYMSPEVINKMDHSFTSDYFALGIITYELMMRKVYLYNQRPFKAKSRNEIKQEMNSKMFYLKPNDIPQGWSLECMEFINILLKVKPEERLGSKSIEEIKNHIWFYKINWKKLKQKKINAPFLPCNVAQKQFFIEQISETSQLEGSDQILTSEIKCKCVQL